MKHTNPIFEASYLRSNKSFQFLNQFQFLQTKLNRGGLNKKEIQLNLCILYRTFLVKLFD